MPRFVARVVLCLMPPRISWAPVITCSISTSTPDRMLGCGATLEKNEPSGKAARTACCSRASERSTANESPVRLRTSGPLTIQPTWRVPPDSLVAAMALRALSASFRRLKLKSFHQRSPPGCVRSSTCGPPSAPPFQRMRTSRICDPRGIASPTKPFTFSSMSLPMSCWSTASASSGSSGRSAICSGVNTLAKASSISRSASLGATLISSTSPAMRSSTSRLMLAPPRTVTWSEAGSKPGDAIEIVYVPVEQRSASPRPDRSRPP